MLNPHPFNCDICNAAKQPSNNWLIGQVTGVVLHDTTEGSNKTVAAVPVIVSSWDDLLATFEGVAHLCGIECAAKWSTKKFDELKK